MKMYAWDVELEGVASEVTGLPTVTKRAVLAPDAMEAARLVHNACASSANSDSRMGEVVRVTRGLEAVQP